MKQIRNFPSISKLKSKPLQSINKKQPKSCRAHFDDLDLEAHILLRKYGHVKNSVGPSNKLRKVYNSLIKLIQSCLNEKFGGQIGIELGHMLNRLVYLCEGKHSLICKDSQNHEHQDPEFKVFLYECLQREYQAWNIEKQKINQQILQVNKRVEKMEGTWEEKIKLQRIIHLNEKLMLKTNYQKNKRQNFIAEQKDLSSRSRPSNYPALQQQILGDVEADKENKVS